MPPNILVVMGDHHRADAFGCLGNDLARTPNLDRLLSESVRFTDCYSQSPVCSPARHSLATGRYAHAHGVVTNNAMPLPGMTTIAHALQPLGYRRLGIGHMHWRDPDMETGYEGRPRREGLGESMSEAVRNRYAWEQQHITRRSTGGPSPRTREQYPGWFDARDAVAFMEECVADGDPFLCWCAFSEPHPPFYPPKDLYERIDLSAIELPPRSPEGAAPPAERILRMRREWEHLTDTELRQIIAGYYGMVALLDEYVGTVLESVERLGVLDDTIIVFTSDHGDQMGEHDLFLKFCMYEASVHIPLAVRIPGGTPGVRSGLVEHIDLFPTLCELVGAETPPSAQGRSIAPLLDDPAATDVCRDAVFSQIGPVRMIRTADRKLVTYDHQPGELYLLDGDPEELVNRIDDDACSAEAHALDRRLREWEERTAPTT